MMKRLLAKVSGRVQGVGYRASVHRGIKPLNVKGYVKNMPDGTVEIVAEGEESELLSILEIARRGSPFCKVEDIATSYSEFTGEFSSFEIAY